MPTQNFLVTDQQADLIEALVQSGRYRNASEVVREGLQIFERRETDDNARLAALRAAVDRGTADFQRGDSKEFPDAASLAEHLDGIAARVRSAND